MYESCFWFKTYSIVEERDDTTKKPKSKKLVELSLENNLSNINNFFIKNEDNVWYDTDRIDLKKPQNQQLEKMLGWKNTFAFVFKAHKEKDVVQKEIRFLMKSSTEEKWWMSFKDSLRNVFLQSAIIPSFRDTKDQLRITNYSWYGKLLKKYIKSDDPDLIAAFDKVKEAWKHIFEDMDKQVSDSKINIAFPNTTISFQFNPEKQEVYKNTQIYVDDGFNSLLQDKWSGIQSAVIIWLFDFYIRNIAHSASSLLAIEEPELYLHPHWRRVISDRLNDFLDWWKNQVIISTHSAEFIVPLADDLNIIVLRKDKNKWTQGKNIDFSDNKKRQILIKRECAEMFFADLVILTEDCKYFIEEVAKTLGNENDKLWKHWLNNNNVTILNCWGKSRLHEYKNLLNLADIPNYILADFDYLRDWWIENNIEDPLKTKLTTLKSKLTTIYPDLEIDFNDLESNLRDKKYAELKPKIENMFTEIKKRIVNWNYKRIEDISPENHPEIMVLMWDLKQVGIFLLKWELEDLYITGKEPTKNKEWWVIETIWKMMETNEDISNFINIEQLKEFLTYIVEQQKIIKEENIRSVWEENVVQNNKKTIVAQENKTEEKMPWEEDEIIAKAPKIEDDLPF